MAKLGYSLSQIFIVVFQLVGLLQETMMVVYRCIILSLRLGSPRYSFFSLRNNQTCSVGEQALELDSLYYSHLPQYRPVLDSSHSLELSYNFEEGPGTKEMPFSRFPSSPFNQQGSFFQCDDSVSMLGTSQSSYNGFEDSCIESLQSSSIRSSMVSQSDVFNPLPIAKPYLRTRYSYMEGSSSTRRRLDADTTVTHSWHETDLPRDEVHPLPPGENNPNAVPGGKLCFEYMNKGR